MAKVELKGIGKVYDGGVRAVSNANITIEDKEFCVFVKRGTSKTYHYYWFNFIGRSRGQKRNIGLPIISLR